MSSQRSDWRERLNANPSRMEQELAIRLQDDGITYLDRPIARDLLPCLVPSGRETRGPLCELGLGDAGLCPCCVWAELLRSRNVRCCWFWLDPGSRFPYGRCWQSGSRIVDALVGWR